MESKEKKKTTSRGLSVRKFNFFMCIVAVLVSFVMFFAMQYTSRLYNETRILSDNMVQQTRYAHDMQDASDYLTEQIRSFVISGEKKYLDNYFEEANVTRRRDNALEKIGEYSPDSEAYKRLSQAMDESVDLMNTEYYAAKLAALGYGYDLSEMPAEVANTELLTDDEVRPAEAKKQRAEEVLFDENYKSKKATITTHMQGCLRELTDELAEEQTKLLLRLERQVMLEHLLTIVLIVIMLVIVIVASSQVFYPLRKSVDFIREEKEIPLVGAYELRFIAKNYNLMTMKNRQKKEKLIYDASHDKLTGLYNRRGYEYLLDNIDIETSAILLIDLDNFKGINDTYGHDIGDKILVRVSNALLKQFKDDSYICRLGGDEFVVIMIHTDNKRACVIKDRITAINEKINKQKKDIPAISISAGVSFGSRGKTVETVFKEADTALYNAKDKGRNGMEFF